MENQLVLGNYLARNHVDEDVEFVGKTDDSRDLATTVEDPRSRCESKVCFHSPGDIPGYDGHAYRFILYEYMRTVYNE